MGTRMVLAVVASGPHEHEHHHDHDHAAPDRFAAAITR
jgi:hypothetical protein